MTEQKANLICFPSIKEVKVHNYPLFDYLGKNHFTINWKDGLNLVLGANSIGKSTFLNMVIYGIVGNFVNAEKTPINPRFFKTRLKGNPMPKNSKIEVTFSIGDMNICVARNLQTNHINKFTNNDINIHEYYPTYLQKHTKIYSFNKEGKVNLDNLAFVLKYLVIREEESNYLLWEKNNQAKIFSILFNEVGVHTKIESLKKEYKDKKDEIKIKEETLNRENQWFDILEKKQKQELASISELPILQRNLTNFTSEKKKLEIIIQKQRNEITNSKSRYNEKNAEYQAKKAYLEELRQNKWNSEKNIKKLEDANNALSSQLASCILILKSELEKNEICSCCNTKVSTSKSETILSKIHDKKCPVCNSGLEKAGNNKTKEQIIEEIARFRQELFSIEAKIQAISQQCGRLQIEKNNLWEILANKESECYRKRGKITRLELEIEELRKNISDFSINGKLTISKYDDDIKKQRQKIKALNEVIKTLEKDRQELDKKLTIKRTAFNKKIKSMEKDISEKFAEYTEEFFRTSRLKYPEAKNKKINELTSYFTPILEGKERKYIEQVSSSEKVFLEYIFRLVILEMYHKKSKNKIFFMLETSEGVFDASNTEQLAKVFYKIGFNEFPIILISNKSKKDFIEKLKIEKPYDLVEHGKNLTDKQKNDLGEQSEFNF
ncbi:MAG: AAA family ATPase [Chitinophagales bacterium]